MNINSKSSISQIRSSCTGTHLLLNGLNSIKPQLWLASLLSEYEAKNTQVTNVTLCVKSAEDATWVEPALHWLSFHQRAVLLRSSVVIPRSLMEPISASQAVVVFESAHHRLELQRALLGPGADGAAAMLLQAQHLSQRKIAVAINLGPLLPAIHDRPEQMRPLLQHIAAAAIEDVHLSFGRLTPARLQALAQVLSREKLQDLQRVFSVDQGSVETTSGSWRLSRIAHYAFFEHMKALVHEHGLRMDHCGCAAFCHLQKTIRRSELPSFQAELFAEQTAC